MNQKDLRIKKLFNKGLKIEQIARKIGYGGNMEEGKKRVLKTLKDCYVD